MKKHLRYGYFLPCLVAFLLALTGCNKQAAPTAESSNSAATNPNSNATPSGQSAADQTAANSTAAPSAGASAPAAVPAPAPEPLVIKTGTRVSVTLDQSVSSKDANPGDAFEASLSAPITKGDQVVIPRGAHVKGTIVDAKSAGRFKGNASLTLDLESVTAHGKTYRIRTTTVERASKARGKRTAIGTGGGAVFGALVGAIAGGGKGAAIGAAAGGGAGAAGAGLTGNREVTLPAETHLEFQLIVPLKLDAE